jgi:glycosyltransferase involved in cell wall biosynthesis
MKIVICDITGRTINYDLALAESIQDEIGDSSKLQLWVPKCNSLKVKVKRFFSFVPSKCRNSSNLFLRTLKVLDTFCAYFAICIRMLIQKPDIFHLQWFPFISLGTTGAFIDISFIRLIKFLSPKTKYVFTIHNICPHGMRENDRINYNPVFSKVLFLFDHFVVHTENTKKEVCQVLGIKEEKVSVVYHGVFVPEGVSFSPVHLVQENLRVIMYGNQNWYKGTDVFVESLNYLSDSVKKRIKVVICGAISPTYLTECKSYESDVRIEWIPRFVSDETLYDCIKKSDIIVLPYRRISQSGVLLLALSTRRFIITSDLDNFKETLKGFDDNLFFKVDDPKDLARVITMYADKQVEIDKISSSIAALNELYSWKRSAQTTLQTYKSLVCSVS